MGGTSQMRAEYLWGWLREHRAQEVAAEAEDKGLMSELGGMERGTKDRR